MHQLLDVTEIYLYFYNKDYVKAQSVDIVSCLQFFSTDRSITVLRLHYVVQNLYVRILLNMNELFSTLITIKQVQNN